MKKLIIILTAILLLAGGERFGYCYLDGKLAHEKMIYPVVRITHGMFGGSGTAIYSKIGKVGYSTYILTNHHVIASAISVESKWDSDLQKEAKQEKRSIVYVESFKYRELSDPIGTLKIEAEIILYDQDADLALIKLRSEDKFPYIAELLPKDGKIFTMDETVAVGCSLLWPPVPTRGVITRKNFQVDSLPYHTSSSQIIYGNSGGAMFTGDGKLIGIPSMVAIIGWGTPIVHMGLFIPLDRIYKWLEKEDYQFIYDPNKKEDECLKVREDKIKKKKEK